MSKNAHDKEMSIYVTWTFYLLTIKFLAAYYEAFLVIDPGTDDIVRSGSLKSIDSTMTFVRFIIKCVFLTRSVARAKPIALDSVLRVFA